MGRAARRHRCLRCRIGRTGRPASSPTRDHAREPVRCGPVTTAPSAARLRRVLIVTPTVPYPPNWGFGIRVYNIIRELGRTCDVSVVCYADRDDAAKVDELRRHCV